MSVSSVSVNFDELTPLPNTDAVYHDYSGGVNIRVAGINLDQAALYIINKNNGAQLKRVDLIDSIWNSDGQYYEFGYDNNDNFDYKYIRIIKGNFEADFGYFGRED